MVFYIYGTKDWLDYTNINNDHKNRFNFRFVSSTYLDYYTDPMIKLNTKFRQRYETDMSKFAVQGYDIFMKMSSYFFLDDAPIRLMANDFDLQQISPADGFENNHIFVLEQEEYELINVDLKDDE